MRKTCAVVGIVVIRREDVVRITDKGAAGTTSAISENGNKERILINASKTNKN